MYIDFRDRLGIGTLFTTVISMLSRERDSIIYRPALPPSYPLAVRNPYLSTWMPSDQVKTLPYSEPQFWAGQSLSWSVMARIDGETYSLMNGKNAGVDILPAVVSSAEYTSTHSIFTLSAGPVTVTLDFFSPVSPFNHLRQSLPFSYLTVSLSAASSSSIQIYSSIDDRWVGKQENTDRNFQMKDTTAIFSLGINNSTLYEERNDMATWGEAIFASRSTPSSKLSFASGKCENIRSHFIKTGQLNGNDPWLPGGIVALSHDLGIVTGSQSVRFAVGYVREKAINYLGAPYTGYYRANYSGTPEAVTYFLDDYQDALRESLKFDLELSTKAKATAGQKTDDEVPCSGALAGAISLAYVRATGDREWVAKYQDIMRPYADYLVDNGVEIAEQLSSNDAAGPLANETNLAIKAAVGIKAFGQLTGLTEYSRIGKERADLFFNQRLGTDQQKTHFVLQYPDKPASWKIPYNLYPDVLLDLDTFPPEVHQMSSAFFKSVRGEFGVPLDSRQDWAKSDWNMWLAATFELDTRNEFVEDLWTFMTNGKHNWPFSDRYVATSAKGASPGVPILCRARPTPRPPHNFGPQGYPLPNGATGPVPGATPLLPNNGRVIQNGPVRVLCIADARADHIIHTGDFGFYDDTSLDRIAEKTLKHVAQYSPLLPENVKRAIAQTPPQQSIKQRFSPDQLPLSELSMLLDKRLTLDVPVYTVWGACEDVRVLEKFRSGEYKVNNLHIIDEANSRLLDIGGVKLRLLGLGGAVVMHKLFDNGEGKTTIAGGLGTMWTTLLQMGELIDTANRVYDPSETRIFVTHASPAREGMLNQLSVTLKADFSISAGLHFRYGSSYNEFSVNPSLDHYRGKLAASKASFNDVWETVRGEVEAAIASNEAQKTLLDNALDVVQKMPTIANGGNPFGGPTGPGNAAGQVDESAFKNMWNFNLADAAFGFLVLEIEAGRIATEMRAQGFNFAHRGGKPPVPAVAGQPNPPVPTGTPGVASPAARPAVPQFGQAQPVAGRPAAPQQPQPQPQQGQAKAPAAAPARTSPVPVIPKPATPQPSGPAASQHAPTSPEKAAEANGTSQPEKPSESPMPRPEKKQSNGLFVSNVDNEQAVRDLFPEEDKAKIVKLDKWGKYNHVVMFNSVEEAKAALDRQPPEHKKPTPPGQPRKPNIKFFEDRGSHRGNAGTWQSSNRGGNTSQRGYQSGGASDSEGGRGRGGFSGRGRGRGDRGRGGRGGRGGFNKGGPTSDSPAPSTSTPSGEKPAAAGDA
ncbi:hypothetical protein BDV30DRAFT_230229 [Aspergillus minisclerotigenes]|uniref:DUF1793-domain-containing protein n=1 Tax=Aspergillus minisclerotigenes TaxID=656917 RepID=A0A5N6ISV0_9EURO|nr:hypothetical protein BDV30DRAFT_230229 [Aspergillus minisclerotigenes]